MKSGIYQIINLRNGKTYIGSAADLSKRKHDHFKRLRNQNHWNIYFQRAFNKYGEDAFEFEVLQYCEPELLIKYEQYWLDHCGNLYNIAVVAGSNLGFKFSEETKKKMSAIKKGKRPYVATKGTKIKMSLSKKGRKLPRKTREKMSETHKKLNIVGSQRSYAIINELQARIIFRLARSKQLKQYEIATIFGVKNHIVADINNLRTWGWLLSER